MFIVVLIIGLLVMAGVIFMEQAQRRIPVQYAKRMVGRRLLGGTTTYIPMKVNQAGVIPVIFASSMLYLPVLYAQFQPGTADNPNPVASWIAANLATGSWIYELIFFVLIIFFAYFYVSITFDPVSYTHLDVYKRQFTPCPGRMPGITPTRSRAGGSWTHSTSSVRLPRMRGCWCGTCGTPTAWPPVSAASTRWS